MILAIVIAMRTAHTYAGVCEANAQLEQHASDPLQ